MDGEVNSEIAIRAGMTRVVVQWDTEAEDGKRITIGLFEAGVDDAIEWFTLEQWKELNEEIDRAVIACHSGLG